jgi:hypothetical protein
MINRQMKKENYIAIKQKKLTKFRLRWPDQIRNELSIDRLSDSTKSIEANFRFRLPSIEHLGIKEKEKSFSLSEEKENQKI